MARKVLHIIDSLVTGGAELLLVKFIQALPDIYESTVVTLHEPSNLQIDLPASTTLIRLNISRKKQFWSGVGELSAIIRERQIDLVHTHLYWSTIVARLATLSGVPLIFTVHNMLSEEVFRGSYAGKWLERLTYSAEQQAVFVSEACFKDYARHVALGRKAVVVYNFVDDAFFLSNNSSISLSDTKLKLVAVGNLKSQKNYKTLIVGMGLLRQEGGISLDIYGEGPERNVLEKQIKLLGLQNVTLCGSQSCLNNVLPKYDLFVLSSRYEGFCIAMAEAMAVGLPCLVSSLDVFKEVSAEGQVYFDPLKPEEFASKARLLLRHPELREKLAHRARETAKKYCRSRYVEAMTNIYDNLLLHRHEEI